MRISLVIESDSLEGFLSELGQLQAINLDQRPAKVMADVGGLAKSAQKPTKPEKPAEPEKPATPEKEPETPAPGRAEPPAEEEQPAAAQATVEAKPRRGRPKKAAATPTAPEAPIETVAAAPKSTGKAAIFTRDDLTAVFREYVTKFGYSAAAADVSKLLQNNLGAGVRKSSDVSDDAIPRAIEIVKAAVTENPFKREIAANG